ncbi:MAG: translation initiation factor [Saprospiraceae bacterium]|nr:translation initiation factor [Saprospiraceae bacterium]
MAKKLNNLSDLSMAYSTHSHEPEVQDMMKNSNYSNQVVRVQLDSKLRGGKAVTKVLGLNLMEKELESLAKEFKQKCGVGGSSKEGIIIIQGDHVEKIIALLIAKGFKNTKRTGG